MQSILHPGQRLWRSFGRWLVCWFVFVGMPVLAQEQPKEQPYVLSTRVGAELDSVEVEYFNVFPELDHVRSVVYRKDNLDNVRMLISLANGGDTTITFSSLAAAELGKMIDHFEQLSSKPELVNWKLLPGYNQNRFNYFENSGRNLRVRFLNGSQVTGRILMVSDSAIFLWTKSGDFDPVDFMRHVMIIRPSEVKEVLIRPNISSKLFGASIGAGIAIGALQIGYNLTGESDFLLSTNSIVLLGIGAAAGSIGGYLFDSFSVVGRKKKFQGSYDQFVLAKKRIATNGMFRAIFPPELKTLPGMRGY
jgi:hypothetical protein